MLPFITTMCSYEGLSPGPITRGKKQGSPGRLERKGTLERTITKKKGQSMKKREV